MKALRSSLHSDRRDAGGVLALALVSVVTVAGLTAAFLQISTSVSRRQTHMRDKLLAFYAAEAGLAESWAGVQIGRTGAVGSEADPVLWGSGLFWVEAVPLDDGLVRLDSTGMVNSGRATLSLVVREPKESVAALGVYSEAPIELPPGSYVDGYDSRLGYGAEGANAPSELLDGLDALDQFLQQTAGSEGEGTSGTRDASFAQRGGSGLGGIVGGVVEVVEETVDDTVESVVGALDPDDLEFTGRIASGGGITVLGSPELPTVVRGSLVPGPGQSASVGADVTVTGETGASASPQTLPEIQVPSLPSLSGVQHTGSAPLLILPTEATLPLLQVGRGAEVVVQGPARLVVADIRLAAGATLYFDTADGPVELYLTGPAAFDATARISNGSGAPKDLALNITASAASLGLPAGAPLHAVVYAPQASLSIPAGFELFGTLVAQAITFAGPPKLHFDEHLLEAAREQETPQLVSWRILELENNLGDGASDPFRLLGVDRTLLRSPSLAHADVPISVRYLDGVGAAATYDGPESGFDWSAATGVEALTRNGQTVVDDVSSRSGSSGTIASLLSNLARVAGDTSRTAGDVLGDLVAASPISKDAIEAFLMRADISSSDAKTLLEANVPQPDSILVRMLQSTLVSSSDCKSVLLAHSPGLSSEVLRRAQLELSPSDYTAVLAAQ